ncbi:glycerol-3-phosphate 1-O-acyltransferase [Aldersonia kunmingensis]|uniref:glycerol-3-phosphate 1-O-acyltransferase n=1 Tax=Aldersonia kunmingensis TaxID=408066 RepID=UPI0008302973|nr:glycerol-3-phosphate 1-O-acyltransferase [Aldersonia kunmingensis]
MTQELTSRPSAGPSGSDQPPIVVLIDASTTVEHDVIDRWLATEGLNTALGLPKPDSRLDLDLDEVATHLTRREDDPLIVPVRVLWLPPERDGIRRARFSDLVFSNPRDPHRLMQRWIVRNAPDRHRVLTGRPARLSELCARYADREPTRAALARSIIRAARLSLDRSERAVIGARYKVPQHVAEEILESIEFRRQLDGLADDLGIEHGEAYRRAENNLRDMVATQTALVSDLFNQVMRPLHRSAWQIDADESSLAKLRRLNERQPLIFLPSHRSYVDPFVLDEVLARNDFPPSHLIGGANLNFWPIGPLARLSGAIFIRRSFGDDEIYKACVAEYLGYLLAKRFNLEWYFEGGRTRTGKLRPPRYGLLNYLAASVRTNKVDDVLLVPVSITYERLNELGAIAVEQLGGGKKSEGISWFVNYIRSQQKAAGKVYVRFGEPLSARGRLFANGDPLVAAGGNEMPASVIEGATGPDDDGEARLAVQKVAFELAVGINDVTPVTVNAVVTLALLGVQSRALTGSEVRAVVRPVLDYIEKRGIPKGDLDLLRSNAGLVSVLEELSAAKVVTIYAGGDEPVYSIEPGQHLIAAFYRNSAMHWFVNRALLELSALAASENPAALPFEKGWAEAERLRDMLKYEFFFPDRETFREQMKIEVDLIDPDWRTRSVTALELLDYLTKTGFMMVHRTLRSFFDAQLVVAERLCLRGPEEDIDRKTLITECVGVGQQMLLQSRLHSPESVSSELFASAIRLANNRGLLTGGGEDLAARRDQFAADLRDISSRITKAALLDESNRRLTGGLR